VVLTSLVQLYKFRDTRGETKRMGWKDGSKEKRDIIRSIVKPRTKPPSDSKEYKRIVVDTIATGRSCGIESKSPLK
jgi:hypothetical protein